MLPEFASRPNGKYLPLICIRHECTSYFTFLDFAIAVPAAIRPDLDPAQSERPSYSALTITVANAALPPSPFRRLAYQTLLPVNLNTHPS
jgi:hypothetical protein